MVFLSKVQITEHLPYSDLVSALRKAFAENPDVPARQHLRVQQSSGKDATLLLMPAWNEHFVGVKIASVFPGNVDLGKPVVDASYILKNGVTGEILAMLDGSALTTIRTAATSALASSYLSRTDSKTLLMVGAGALAAPLIRSHTAVRSFDKVIVWNRSSDRVEGLRQELAGKCDFEYTSNLNVAVEKADVISCATLSYESLVKGRHVSPGTHVDLVGAYLSTMRETDAELIERANVHVDTRIGARLEAGDLIQAEKEGPWTFDLVKSELSELCAGVKPGRTTPDEITVFKSVGYSLEDLVAAVLAYTNYTKS
ncbi:MAG: ornithine cyclodeaminase family protein [Bacteroidetes bacterium]|nr:ornithine cyclodeaminase family protein [Bacteroidota bacterium]